MNARRKLRTLAAPLITATFLCLGTIAFSHEDEQKGGEGRIVGQVTDVSGIPVEGVTVSVKKGPSAVTDAGGAFTLAGVKQRKRIIVDFRKPGYVSTQAITSLKTTGDSDGDDGEDDADEAGSRKLESVTLDKTMLASGAAQTLDTSTGGTIEEEGFRVTFPAGSLGAAGMVDVSVSPVDVSTGELLASPGEFKGRTHDGSNVLLEAHALMNVSITQDGQSVNLKSGARATLEFVLPADTTLVAGEVVPLWFYSEADGRWSEEGSGTVGASTSDPGRLSVIGEVSHFTWWGAHTSLTGDTTPTPTPTPTSTPTPTPTPDVTCLKVIATYLDDGRLAVSATVWIYDDFGNLLATGTTDGAGRVCFENLPADTYLRVHASDGKGQSTGTDANTGAGGGSCALSSCVQVVLKLALGT